MMIELKREDKKYISDGDVVNIGADMIGQVVAIIIGQFIIYFPFIPAFSIFFFLILLQPGK